MRRLVKPHSVALLVAAISLGQPAWANTFNSGHIGQPIIGGVSASHGEVYTLEQLDSDQFIQTNTGTVIVWSSTDHVLRKYWGLGGLGGYRVDYSNKPSLNFVDPQDNSPAFMGYNGTSADGATPLWSMQFQMSVGIYGPDSYLQNPSPPDVTYNNSSLSGAYGTTASPGDIIGSLGVGNPGVSVYNQVTVLSLAPAGPFDVNLAWEGVADSFYAQQGSRRQGMQKPSNLASAWSSIDGEYGLSKLPTVNVTWQGSYQSFATMSQQQCGLLEASVSWACRYQAPTYGYRMVNGTDSIACDPVQLQFQPDLAAAVFGVNGIYCDHLAVHPSYSVGDPVPLPPPVPVTYTGTDASPGLPQQPGYHATGQVLTDVGTLGVVPMDRSGCMDSAGNGQC